MKQKHQYLHTGLGYVIVALLIGYFFPREGTFKYQFFEGKPWRYGLLTAPNDFPIYKQEWQVKAERDSILRLFEPYYHIDSERGVEQIQRFRQDFSLDGKRQIASVCSTYIDRQLVRFYRMGIIELKELEELRTEGKERVHIMVNNVSRTVAVDNLLSVRTAYQSILDNRPPGVQTSSLQSLDLNHYLVPNLAYDVVMAEKIQHEMVSSLSPSSGMVQAGERIVDRGEIINEHTYAVLQSLKTIHESRSGGMKVQSLQSLGVFLLVCGILFCYWLFLRSFRRKLFASPKHTSFLLLCILTPCLLTEWCMATGMFNEYLIPYAIVPIMVCTFFDARTALFTHLVVVLICSIMTPFPHEFLLMQTIAGMVANYALADLSERSQLLRCAAFILLAYVLTYTCLAVYQQGNLSKINTTIYLYLVLNFVLLMFAYLLIYILEKIFGYISPVTLVELSNINAPLLKQLSETAPGTFQHSLQVSILASDAASKIGSNSVLVRTGAMYHDIGKMNNPAFFTENLHGGNPHDRLSFEQSASVVIRHVFDGIRIAHKAGLPEAITDFIHTHHGTGKARYFYHSYLNAHPGEPVPEESFTYPGPDPHSKETSILMMADAVEAASRSLKEHTEKNIRQLIDRIIDTQIADGLHKYSPLTFRDIEKIKQVFCDKIQTMYHTRISYPEDNK
ncbi:MAG: HDIG domain-containing protein [Tannerellaceae bacterium]|nr:HDIG domain-containing protein [Tannerellaceae bacterium]